MKHHRRQRGFTLVELLVTVTVIGLVVAMAMGALMKAQDSAREQRTRGLIAKLHTQLMYRWESYETRRLPISPPPGSTAQQLAWHRLHAMRELMRLEMPDRWSDVTDPANQDMPVYRHALLPFDPANRELNLPALSEAYLRFYTSISPRPSIPNEGAECLYLIVTMGHDDSLGGQKFNASDVGDVDQDGAKEFIDGWGRPISFLRWAPGFLPQSVDPGTGSVVYAGHNPGDLPYLPPGVDGKAVNVVSDLQTGDSDADHDPFDPLDMDGAGDFIPFNLTAAQRQGISNDRWRGYRLMPLIYSAGPDGIFDITREYKANNVDYSLPQPLPNDPYMKLPDNANQGEMMIGTPGDADVDGSIDHMDNITNHALGVR